ncbi:MAG: hypothetical protein RR331_07900 [Bacteroides sp.]
MRKLSLISIAMLIVSIPTFAGGLLTNTNQHALFLRMLARDASTEIDAVHSNPAGVVFMENGFHLSFNVQSVSQTRTIRSTFAPFAGYGGNPTKTYEGEASAPFVPSVFAAYKKDKWAFSAGFAITGGGGKATFNNGLGSFESQVAMIPGLLKSQGIDANKYSVNSFMEGKQFIFGLQLGASYKITDYLSVFGGARINYVSNAYSGYIKDIQANLGGGEDMMNLNRYFTTAAASALQAAEAYKQAGDMEMYKKYMIQSKTAEAVANKTADMELDCEQTGWGITPIIGADFKMGKWNIGMKYEFKTSLNVENKTKGSLPAADPDPKKDKYANYRDGVNTPHDVPSLLTVGVSYEFLPVLRAAVGYHHFFDTHADMATVQDPATGNLVAKQNYIGNGTNEYLAGIEWDVCKWAQVSCGLQRTKYGVEDNYQTDMSFSLSSYTYGCGAGFKIAKNLKLNVSYFWSNYDDYEKISANYNGTGMKGVDLFSRTNKVFGVGLDYKF